MILVALAAMLYIRMILFGEDLPKSDNALSYPTVTIPEYTIPELTSPELPSIDISDIFPIN